MYKREGVRAGVSDTTRGEGARRARGGEGAQGARRVRMGAQRAATLLLVLAVAQLGSPLGAGGLAEAEIASWPSAGQGAQRDEFWGAEVLWEVPRLAARGVLLVLHGCNHGAYDFWPRDSIKCPHCTGLPEERRLVRRALERRYVVVAVSSQNRKSNCWSSHTDSGPLRRALTELWKRERWGALTFYVFGASSGGSMVRLAAKFCHACAVFVRSRCGSTFGNRHCILPKSSIRTQTARGQLLWSQELSRR